LKARSTILSEVNNFERTGSIESGVSEPSTPDFFSDGCFVIDDARVTDIQAAVDAGEISAQEAEQTALSFGYLGWEDRF